MRPAKGKHAARRSINGRQTVPIGTAAGDQVAQPLFLPRAQRFLLARATTPTPSRQGRLARLCRRFDPLTDKLAVHPHCLGRFDPRSAGLHHRYRERRNSACVAAPTCENLVRLPCRSYSQTVGKCYLFAPRVSNFQLVDAETGAQLAADRFRADATNAMEAQNEITRRIARTLFYKVAHSERLRIKRETPGDLTARDLVMLGWDKLNRPNMKPSEVQRLLERALELDPQSVNARLGLAKLLLDQVVYPRTDASQRTEARIEQLLSEALRIGANQTETYATTGTFACCKTAWRNPGLNF